MPSPTTATTTTMEGSSSAATTTTTSSTPLAKRFTPHMMPLYIAAFAGDRLISYRITKDDSDDVFRILPPDGKTWTVRPSRHMTNTQTIAALTIAASIRNDLLIHTEDGGGTDDIIEISIRCRFGQTMCRLGSITWPDLIATDDHSIAHHIEGVMDLLGMIHNQ